MEPPFPEISERTRIKVPEATALFWTIKVLTTGMGETTSDFFVHRVGPGPTVPVAGLVLVVCLWLQFRAPRYVAWSYWLAVVMVAVFGTMVADALHIGFGVPYSVSTPFFAIGLVLVFATWYTAERTLSIHTISTPRREAFYWAAVMATFALGTAAGDLTAVTLHLGYLSSGFLFTAAIALPALTYGLTRRNAVLAFWAAYVLTRPLGASYADWLGVSHARGGLGLGTGLISLILAAGIAGLVILLTLRPVGPTDD